MREGRPSTTAAVVSLARGLATVKDAPYTHPVDPLATSLLPPAMALALRAVAAAPRTLTAVRAASLGLVDHIALRTLAIDDALRGAIARGARQLVLLGAGLDARAFRLPELAPLVVFEVDHPATQRYKRARTERLRPLARDVVWAAIDFEREELGARLAAAGHDADLPTAWIWEGVVPYLAPDAVDATLAVVAARSAPASTLLVTYATPAMYTAPPALMPLFLAGFRVLGEPLRSLMTPDDAASRVRGAGFTPLADTGVDAWAARWLTRAPPRLRLAERLLVATRR